MHAEIFLKNKNPNKIRWIIAIASNVSAFLKHDPILFLNITL